MLKSIFKITLIIKSVLFLSGAYANPQEDIISAYDTNKAISGSATPQTKTAKTLCMISWGMIGELLLNDTDRWSGTHPDFNYNDSNWLYEYWLDKAMQAYGSEKLIRFAQYQKKLYNAYWQLVNANNGDIRPLFMDAGLCYVSEDKRSLATPKIGIKNAVKRYGSVALPETFLKELATAPSS